jgi:ketosteroid isomerase-like protein
MFAEDAVWWVPDAPAIEGRAAIRAATEPDPGIAVQEFTVTSLEIDGYGDLAFDRGAFTYTVVSEGAEEPITFIGKYVVIARKQEDGAWLWTLNIWNTDAPMPRPE